MRTGKRDRKCDDVNKEPQHVATFSYYTTPALESLIGILASAPMKRPSPCHSCAATRRRRRRRQGKTLTLTYSRLTRLRKAGRAFSTVDSSEAVSTTM